MKYGTATKKPVLIDWFLWKGSLNNLSDWITSKEESPSKIVDSIDDNSITIKTLEGSSYNVPEGYIIIRGVEGEYYPCDPKIFEKTYNIMVLNKK